MVKKITLIILILLCCVTGYSQSRRPKSAKKPTIQDVITEKKTPEDILKEEVLKNITSEKGYVDFQKKSDAVKNQLLCFLLKLKNNSNTVAAYGAAAKGNTLLNYAGIRPDLLPIIYDAAPSKQGKFMPGSHIPIQHPDDLMNEPPEYVIVLPWNLGSEISNQLSEIKKRGTKLVLFIPKIKYL